jgi:hypothetical protein
MLNGCLRSTTPRPRVGVGFDPGYAAEDVAELFAVGRNVEHPPPALCNLRIEAGVAGYRLPFLRVSHPTELPDVVLGHGAIKPSVNLIRQFLAIQTAIWDVQGVIALCRVSSSLICIVDIPFQSTRPVQSLETGRWEGSSV